MTQAPCPKCIDKQHCDVLKQHEEFYSEEELDISASSSISILRCRGCKTLFVKQKTWNSEDDQVNVTHWPLLEKIQKPDWFYKLSPRLGNDTVNLLSNVYTAANSNLNSLAAIGVRTVFDSSSQSLGVTAYTFKNKLKELRTMGYISPSQQRVIRTLIEAGNAAAHRAWTPTTTELTSIIRAMENFLYSNFVQVDEMASIRKRVPRRSPSGAQRNSPRTSQVKPKSKSNLKPGRSPSGKKSSKPPQAKPKSKPKPLK